MKEQEHPNWNRLAAALRQAGPVDPSGDLSPPPGFATRVLAEVRANARADGLARWRRRALAAAALSCLGCGLLFVALPEPEPQFLPVPEFDLPQPAP